MRDGVTEHTEARECSRPVKVLLIAPQPFFQWRGSPLRVEANAKVLSSLGYEVDLLTLPIGDDRCIPRVRIVRVPNMLGIRDMRIGPSLVKAFFDLLLLVWGICMAIRHKYDVIHGIEDGGFLGFFMARVAGGALIFERHSDPASYRGGFFRNVVLGLYSSIERFTIRRADVVIGTGPGLVKQIVLVEGAGSVHHIFDIPSSNVVATPERTAKARGSLVQSPDDLVVMFVGSFAGYQGVPLLLEAAKRVLLILPQARFAIIGGSLQEIEVLRRDAGLGEDAARKIVFLGRMPPEEIPDYLAAADVLVSPRLGGANTPLKLLDYLKAGRAIVATDVPANRYILDESVAILVPPTADGLAEGMLKALRDEELRRRLGRAGYDLIQKEYGFERYRERLGACYEEVLSQRTRKRLRC